MRNYNFEKEYKNLINYETLSMLTQIYELKGKQNVLTKEKTGIFKSLLKTAKIQSAEASNRIEGIKTTEERLKLIAIDKTMPQSRDEEEIAGYRDVLAIIHDNYRYIPIKPNMILQLHRELYKFSGSNIGGTYKNVNNVIEEIREDGKKHVRFMPVDAWETAESVEELCKEYNKAVDKEEVSPLLLMPIFVLDFLCIHPFKDGNGRISRLLTLLLMYRFEYEIGKYISIEKIIEETKEGYYEALKRSSIGWHEEKNDYEPFVRYMLGVILTAYKEFDAKANLLGKKGLSKPERIEAMIEETLKKVTKREIVEKYSDISDTTVQRTLNDLVKKKKIIKIGGGRYTEYIWNRERGE